MKLRRRVSALVFGVAMSFFLSACGEKLAVPTADEAAEIMKIGIGFPRVRIAELPVEVDKNDWQSAFSVGNRLNQFYKAGLVQYIVPKGKERVYRVTLTDKGQAALFDNEVHPGGTYNRGFYRVKLALDKFDQVFNVAEYEVYELGTGIDDMFTSDVTFGWTPTEVTPYGEAMGIEEGRPEKASKGIIWWAGKWKYMSQ